MMTDKQLLKMTVVDLWRLAKLLGLNLQLAIYTPSEPDIKDDSVEKEDGEQR